jgi:hypothetical protein
MDAERKMIKVAPQQQSCGKTDFHKKKKKKTIKHR